jgi:hypothetical protein
MQVEIEELRREEPYISEYIKASTPGTEYGVDRRSEIAAVICGSASD